MAGTSEKMLDYLLETRLDANADLVGGLLIVIITLQNYSSYNYP